MQDSSILTELLFNFGVLSDESLGRMGRDAGVALLSIHDEILKVTKAELRVDPGIRDEVEGVLSDMTNACMMALPHLRRVSRGTNNPASMVRAQEFYAQARILVTEMCDLCSPDLYAWACVKLGG
jgi:hypothetical protein